MFACFGGGAAEAAKAQQAALGAEIAQLTATIDQLTAKNSALTTELTAKTEQLNARTTELSAARQELQQLTHKAELQAEVNKKALQRQGDAEQLVEQLKKELENEASTVRALTTKLGQKEKELAQKDAMINTKDQQLEDRYKALQVKDQQLQTKDMSLEEAYSQLGQKDEVLLHKDKAIEEKDRMILQREEHLRFAVEKEAEYRQQIERLEAMFQKKARDYQNVRDYATKLDNERKKLDNEKKELNDDLKRKGQALQQALTLINTMENKLQNPLFDDDADLLDLQDMIGDGAWGSDGGMAGYEPAHTTVEVHARASNASMSSVHSNNRYSRSSIKGAPAGSQSSAWPAAAPTVSDAVSGGPHVNPAQGSPNASAVSTARMSVRASRAQELRASRILGLQELRASICDVKAQLQASLRDMDLGGVSHVPSTLPEGIVEEEDEAEMEEGEGESGFDAGFDAARSMSKRDGSLTKSMAAEEGVADEQDVQLFMRSPASSVGNSTGAMPAAKSAYGLLLQNAHQLDVSQSQDK